MADIFIDQNRIGAIGTAAAARSPTASSSPADGGTCKTDRASAGQALLAEWPLSFSGYGAYLRIERFKQCFDPGAGNVPRDEHDAAAAVIGWPARQP